MRCRPVWFFVISCLIFACPLVAQDTTLSSAVCNLDADKQLVVQYQPAGVPKKGLQYGKVWAPGGKPMTLFTTTPVEIEGARLATGAYTLFLIPNLNRWTLIVSKSTDLSGTYDPVQDVVRVPMDFGELPVPTKELKVSFGHIAPTQCNIRVDFEKTGYFATFEEK